MFPNPIRTSVVGRPMPDETMARLLGEASPADPAIRTVIPEHTAVVAAKKP